MPAAVCSSSCPLSSPHSGSLYRKAKGVDRALLLLPFLLVFILQPLVLPKLVRLTYSDEMPSCSFVTFTRCGKSCRVGGWMCFLMARGFGKANAYQTRLFPVGRSRLSRKLLCLRVSQWRVHVNRDQKNELTAVSQ